MGGGRGGNGSRPVHWSLKLRFDSMSVIGQESISRIQPELLSGESILWAGQPDASVAFHKEDLFLIPFSLLWGGFAIFWEAGVLGFWGQSCPAVPWTFGMIWGIPFVLVGQYLILGAVLLCGLEKEANVLRSN